MKNGSTHLAHKAEHAVDLDTDALLAVSRHAGHVGDTTSGPDTLDIAANRIEQLHENIEPDISDSTNISTCVAADKGYHSDAVLDELQQLGMKSYIASKDVKRNFAGKPQQQTRHEANERNLASDHGQTLRKRRAEKVERSMALMYLTGGLRRCWLRGGDNVLKRLQIQAAAYNLGLLVRKLTGYGTPRGLADAAKITLFRFLGQAMRILLGRFAARWPQPNHVNKLFIFSPNRTN